LSPVGARDRIYIYISLFGALHKDVHSAFAHFLFGVCGRPFLLVPFLKERVYNFVSSLNGITIFGTFIPCSHLIEKAGDGLAESGRGLTTFQLHIVVGAHSEAIHYPPCTLCSRQHQ